MRHARDFGRPRAAWTTIHRQMLWALFIILVVLWIMGIVLKIAGAFIHLLLIAAAIVLIIQLVMGRK